jgi:acyl-CoA reductase-like NAD-dependent aldehyde dehydrogenase
MFQNYINGEWVDGARAQDNINPSDTQDIIGQYAVASAAQATDAVSAAAAAFGRWSSTTPQQRADALDRVGSEILSRQAELGDLLAREEGKTTPEARGEVVRAGQIFKFFAGEALRTAGELIPSVRPGVTVDVTREPIGVVGLITPWNFPIAIPSWKIAPALAYGNTVVFKPADPTPGCAWALAEIISRAGLPPGAFNLVMGRGSEIGPALVNDRRVAGISFTGSIATGQSIAQACAARLAKCQLEMGGKNPLVVRLIVTDGIHDRFVDAVVARMTRLTIDDARHEGTDIGPVIHEGQLAQNLEYVDVGRKEGAQLVRGGERLERRTPGYYMAPALFTGASNAMRTSREEIFGPVASVIRVRDYEEALAVANDTPMGLTAGIATSSLKYAAHFKRHADAGMVMVNLPTAGVDFHVPFGGRKASSYGPREQGRYAAEFYTTVKTAYTFAG